MLINRNVFVKWFRIYPLLLMGSIISFITIIILRLLSSFIKIKVGGLISQRLGHLALNTDLFFRRRQLQKVPDNTKYVFLAGAVANQQLFSMWKRHLKPIGIVVQNCFLRAMFHYSERLWERTSFYEPLRLQNSEYREYNNTNSTLVFSLEEEKKGRRILREMGIDPDKDWFVCVYARDKVYMEKVFGKKFFGKKDWSYHDYRNADVNTYRLTIEHIVNRGGYVLRMGYHVNKPVDYKHDRFIDYAIEYRSDFMDVYLTAKCKFFMGTGAGISDMALIFDTPKLNINEVPFGSVPWGKKNLYIPKIIKKRMTGDYFSFAEFARRTCDPGNPILWHGNAFWEAGFEYEDNSDEDILDATIEMMERLDGKFLQTEEDKIMLESYYNIFPEKHWAAQVKNPIGREFLRKYRYLFETK